MAHLEMFSKDLALHIYFVVGSFTETGHEELWYFESDIWVMYALPS